MENKKRKEKKRTKKKMGEKQKEMRLSNTTTKEKKKMGDGDGGGGDKCTGQQQKKNQLNCAPDVCVLLFWFGVYTAAELFSTPVTTQVDNVLTLI